VSKNLDAALAAIEDGLLEHPGQQSTEGSPGDAGIVPFNPLLSPDENRLAALVGEHGEEYVLSVTIDLDAFQESMRRVNEAFRQFGEAISRGIETE
jgi:hypothetical protein